MTKEKIEARLAEARNQLAQLQQQFAATQGVIADLEYWLAELDAKPKVELA